MTFDPVETHSSNGTGDLQSSSATGNEEMSILVLGNTETTGHDKTGTGAKSKTHAEQQLEIIRDAMDYLVSQLNSEQFLNILKSYGLDVDGGEFEFDKEVDIAYLKEFIPLAVSLGTQLGVPLSKKQIYDITGLTPPESEDDAIQLYPTLGQEENNEPDQEDGQKPAAPRTAARAKKPKPKQPQAITAGEVSAMLDEKLRSFFGQAL